MTTLPDTFIYHTPEALAALTLHEVEALWELVPTERQRMYRAIYDRTRRDHGATNSDTLEAQMVAQLIARYRDKALVPVGAYWVPTPPQLQEAAKSDVAYTPADPVDGTAKGKKPPLALVGIGAACVLLFGFLLLRGATGKSATPTKGTLTRTPTPTLSRTYTPTPLALDDQDAIIRGGSAGSGSNTVYPVNLRINVNGAAQPRIFVVQRRVVNTAEWVYDDNPDVASYIVGLSVHPVLGIPYSDANAALFRDAQPGSLFDVQMNTGVALHFRCAEQKIINRGDTTVFGQDKPGLTLVMMGERVSDETVPTADRSVLLADYLPNQQTPLSDIALPTILAPTPTASPTLAERVDVQIVSTTTQPGRLTMRLRVFNGRFTPLTLDSNSIWLTYGYSERPVGPRIAAELDPVEVLSVQAADVTVVFAWKGKPFGTFGVLDEYRYAMTLR